MAIRTSAGRILGEISKVYDNEIEDVIFETVDDDNLFEMHGIIIGPLGTPYEGGQFKFIIKIPNHYPFKFPKFFFKTQILEDY